MHLGIILHLFVFVIFRRHFLNPAKSIDFHGIKVVEGMMFDCNMMKESEAQRICL